MRRFRVMLPLFAALALTAACSGAADPVAAPATSASASAAPSVTASPSNAVPAVLNFTAKTLTGAGFDGASLLGKPAVLWFWSPSCPTCVQQARGVKETAALLAGRVTVVGVVGAEEEQELRRVIGAWELDDVPHLSDKEGTVWQRFSVATPSTFVLLDSAGNVKGLGTFNGDLLLGRISFYL